ncbi:hypothetical protein LTR91_025264 [Friedmanniomyces endolithicus]|uniref:Aminotransferase class I/classII large domain-containing protein n=1 Tax=Friedmanniomyces endolithicus TaxID=329885 RepID=A0AAN6H076_9PEZI|nr:hypothetical protein LTR57_025119 [Friedmanniomyces endolithicus]KAK0951008.1 hypothetical protein LTR91_025264 [Friedmanniomyces endolithicus]KAK0951804.1 hypothetical protein LTS01_025096 [Friedmanniomyces endolithicus]
MNRATTFKLANWIDEHGHDAETVLAGSATPALRVKDLESLSTDPQSTASALDLSSIELGLGSPMGDKGLRERVASLYDGGQTLLSLDNVVIANATTGANLVAFESLLSAGDHVICMYPCYAPLVNIPKALSCDISYWRLDHGKRWEADTATLESLLKPQTQMIILNNPNNPTGSVIPIAVLEKIVDIARQRKITVFADEIFRPLFHGVDADVAPTISLMELSTTYDKTIVTGSMSKVWGMSGVRIGWIVSRNKGFLEKVSNVRLYVLQAVSNIDEIIAREALSERCRSAILNKHRDIAGQNLMSFDDFACKHGGVVSWVRPSGGGTAFVRFSQAETGRPVDDVKFCRVLKERCGVLLTPGSLCFSSARDEDFLGFVRLHLTVMPVTFRRGVQQLEQFLESEEWKSLFL